MIYAQQMWDSVVCGMLPRTHVCALEPQGFGSSILKRWLQNICYTQPLFVPPLRVPMLLKTVQAFITDRGFAMVRHLPAVARLLQKEVRAYHVHEQLGHGLWLR